MKKLLIFAAIAILFLGSCKTEQLATYRDDVYSIPAEERMLAKKAEEEKAKQFAAERQKQEEEAAAQKAKDAANPYYKDPSYNSDDYYDYEYASRINRFQNPVYGASYYDPYYTNMYTYNQNSMMYGMSIYSGYNGFYPASGQFAYYYNSPLFYSPGYRSSFAFSYGSGYNSYNPYWYDPYFGYSPWCGSGLYYGYPYSFGYGYNNCWNTGSWGYINSYDPNTIYNQPQYGRRDGGLGTGSRAGESAGLMREDNGARRSYMESVGLQQSGASRFSNPDVRSRSRGVNTDYNSGRTRVRQDQGGSINYPSGRIAEPGQGSSGSENGTTERRSRTRVRQSDPHENNQNSGNRPNSQDSWNNKNSGGQQGGSSGNPGGGSTPRNSGGEGGGRRPR